MAATHLDKYPPTWQNPTNISGIEYRCGYCGVHTSPAKGWVAGGSNQLEGYIVICTLCNRPTFVEQRHKQTIRTTPAAMIGEDVKGLPADVSALYNEARRCTSVGAHTSTILTCRKVLMHVAVEKGAPPGGSFVSYVEYLAANNYIPPDGRAWVDHIRSKSNEANHEILIMGPTEADDLMSFTEMLLRLVYEFKHRLAPSPAAAPSA